MRQAQKWIYAGVAVAASLQVATCAPVAGTTSGLNTAPVNAQALPVVPFDDEYTNLDNQLNTRGVEDLSDDDIISLLNARDLPSDDDLNNLADFLETRDVTDEDLELLLNRRDVTDDNLEFLLNRRDIEEPAAAGDDQDWSEIDPETLHTLFRRAGDGRKDIQAQMDAASNQMQESARIMKGIEGKAPSALTPQDRVMYDTAVKQKNKAQADYLKSSSAMQALTRPQTPPPKSSGWFKNMLSGFKSSKPVVR